MKFVDEAEITVQGGNGGSGCLSFRREKYVEFGGPDGGNGGTGGSVILVADDQINTLIDFRYQRRYGAQNGEGGRGRNCTGAKGEDLVVNVPIGTSVSDVDTGEEIIDLTEAGQRFVVAYGGKGGVGNAAFKSSVNRAPRQTKPGVPGETRKLRLELKVLADVGLLGLPNAGKSTLVRAMSAAKPKVASYPFTTLVPSLGVVKVDMLRSFVIADIPGLIAGASEGLGLGIRFLRHLARNRLMLHLVDIQPFDGSDVVSNIVAIDAELENFSEALAEVPRWLVFNKTDTMPKDEVEQRVAEIVDELGWEGPVFTISGITGEGTEYLSKQIMAHLEAVASDLKSDEAFRAREEARWERLRKDLYESRSKGRKKVKAQPVDEAVDEGDWDEEDGEGMEVVYAPY